MPRHGCVGGPDVPGGVIPGLMAGFDADGDDLCHRADQNMPKGEWAAGAKCGARAERAGACS